MTLECPLCQKSVETSDLHRIPGSGGGFNCPECKQMLHFEQPHRIFRASLSLTLSAIVLLFFGVRSILFLLGGCLLLWAPVQLLVNGYCVRRMPLQLKPWIPPRQKLEIRRRLRDQRRQARDARTYENPLDTFKP
jgi:hypothetical protein